MELAKIEEKAVLRSMRLDSLIMSDSESDDDHDGDDEHSLDDAHVITDSTDDVIANKVDDNARDVYESEVVLNDEGNHSSIWDSFPKEEYIVDPVPLNTEMNKDDERNDHSYDPDSASKEEFIANPAPSNEDLLLWLRDDCNLNWFELFEMIKQYLSSYSQEVLERVLLDFSDFLPASDLSIEEERHVELSRQAFLEYQRRSNKENTESDIESESANDQDIIPAVVDPLGDLAPQLQEKVRKERRRIKRRAQRRIVKTQDDTSVLKRKITKKGSQLLRKFPDIGKDIENYVRERKVGADAWRRTGVLTFTGNLNRGKKVTYKGIHEYLKKKYNENFSYGAIVQLCVIRNKRRISSKRYHGVAKVTCRRTRKGFANKLNPDARYSCAFYRGLDWIQLKDGKVTTLNRDDQAGFRMDTTYDHKQYKTISLQAEPELTTRTDYVNTYKSVLQTSSYLFMATDTTPEACVGIVKPHGIIPKNPSQHASDLCSLKHEESLKPYLIDKEIFCARVDGAGDEGPSHLEVQFLWAEFHVKEQNACTLVTTRHSGGSYLNRVELTNGGLTNAHANLFIPSTLSGSNFDDSGRVDPAKLQENMKLATEVYINRVQGAPCSGTTVLLKAGEQDEYYSGRRQNLLTFLKGSQKAKSALKEEDIKYFTEIWSVASRHSNKNLPKQYGIHYTLCGKADCIHPRCQNGETSENVTWFPGGPPVTWLPLPVPDLDRPGHYLKPAQLMENRDSPPDDRMPVMEKLPSTVLKEAASDPGMYNMNVLPFCDFCL